MLVHKTSLAELRVLGAILLPTFLGCDLGTDSPTFSRTILVYMIADNNLNSFAWEDINEIEEGFSTLGADSNNRVLVYIDGAEYARISHPVLLEIVPDTGPDIASTVLRPWPEWNSSSPEAMREIISYTISRYPAESYGLVLWSHGTGWLPNDYINTLNGKINSAETKSFGQDISVRESQEMAITALARSLPTHFEFIAFDACYMASVEVAYELRHTARYFLASPTEILSEGFPYAKMLPYFFGGKDMLVQAASAYFEHYDQQPGALRSASITLVDTGGLEVLAQRASTILSSQFTDTELQNIQQYDREATQLFYDLYHLGALHASTGENEFKKAFEDLVLYSRSTESFLGKLNLANARGLSVYLPKKEDTLLEHYKQLDWYRAVHQQ